MHISDIKKRLFDLKPELHRRFGVSEIGVFGSFVRGQQGKDSDIDVLVSFDRPVTLFGLYDLQNYLHEQFACRVDVVLKNGLKENIGRQILAEVQ